MIEQTGPVSYRVQVSGQIWRHHTDQILDHSSHDPQTDDGSDVESFYAHSIIIALHRVKLYGNGMPIRNRHGLLLTILHRQQYL